MEAGNANKAGSRRKEPGGRFRLHSIGTTISPYSSSVERTKPCPCRPDLCERPAPAFQHGKAPALCRVGSRAEPGSHQVGSLGWRLQASPCKGHAHRRQEGIPFSLCWLKLFRQSRARQGPPAIPSYFNASSSAARRSWLFPSNRCFSFSSSVRNSRISSPSFMAASMITWR
jgi:hypothetical protein